MTPTLTVRPASHDDQPALARLAALDSARPLAGDVLMAETEGRALAAVSLADDRAVADPFQLTAEAVAVLRMRADQLRAASRAARPAARRLRLHTASG